MRRPRQRSSFGPRLATIRARRVCTLVLHGRNPPADQREVRAANRTNERPAADLAVGDEDRVSGIPVSGIPWCLKKNGRPAADLPVAGEQWMSGIPFPSRRQKWMSEFSSPVAREEWVSAILPLPQSPAKNGCLQFSPKNGCLQFSLEPWLNCSGSHAVSGNITACATTSCLGHYRSVPPEESTALESDPRRDPSSAPGTGTRTFSEIPTSRKLSPFWSLVLVSSGPKR
jgi:hypothetical protein